MLAKKGAVQLKPNLLLCLVLVFWFFLAVLGFCQAGALTTSHSASLLGLLAFMPRLAWTKLLFMLCSLQSWEDSICLHAQLLVIEMWILRTFCLDWPQTLILLISAFQVARITDLSYCAQPQKQNF
jgi:hypothetical protein